MEPRTLYVFLMKREHDKQAWPVVYETRELAEGALGRVTAIAQVSFDENGNARIAPAIPWGSSGGGGSGWYPMKSGGAAGAPGG